MTLIFKDEPLKRSAFVNLFIETVNVVSINRQSASENQSAFVGDSDTLCSPQPSTSSKGLSLSDFRTDGALSTVVKKASITGATTSNDCPLKSKKREKKCEHPPGYLPRLA
jgi:hypothetical protein